MQPTLSADRKAKRHTWPKVSKIVHRNGTEAWMVDCRISGIGSRHFLASKAEAETKAAQLRTERKNNGASAITSMSDKLRAEALECAEKLAQVGVGLREATAFYLKNAKPVSGTKTCLDAAAELLAGKRASGKRDSYVKALGWSLGKFNREFGTKLLNEVNYVAIEEWLASMEQKVATRRAYLRDIGILFNFGVTRGFCALNPVSRIEKPTLDEGEPEIFTVDEAEALLRVCEKDPSLCLVPYLTIGMFAGLRASELKSLDWEEVDLEAMLIEVKGKKAKTRQRRNVTVSENLASWLQTFHRPSGPIVQGRFRARLVSAVKRARAELKKAGHPKALSKWPKNGLRHSFASYHLPQHSNANQTALEMGHADTTMLFNHYRNLVKPAEAKKFWAIMPTKAAESQQGE